MKQLKYDVVIVGSGISGLFCAVQISKRKDFKGKILILTKGPLAESNSRYAQGGIAAVINSNNDSIESHVNDTLKSGANLCDKSVVQYIIENSQNVIEKLVELNIDFDRDEKGEFCYTLGGAHSAKRVLHSKQDSTGMVIMQILSQAVKNIQNTTCNIDIMQKTMAVELLVEENECRGLVAFDKTSNEHIIIQSSNVILATGGLGQIYKYTTNPYGATGDGIYLAYSANLKIKDIEFIQFHPTALVLGENSKSRYLISEALRGEGAKLVNSKCYEFMKDYSDKKELSSRDVVTRAITAQMELENAKNMYLKAYDIDKDILLKRFPSIAKKCASNGIDITKDLIPIAPAAHYMIGGVETTLDGKTSIKGLYATGELSYTGFHGANRLASNSLLECAVCADILSKNINLIEPKKLKSDVSKWGEPFCEDKTDYRVLKNELKEIMWQKAAILRAEKGLLEAKDEIEKIWLQFKNKKSYSSIEGYEYRNMLLASYLIVKCALKRKESRGAHYRVDYPKQSLKVEHSYICKGDKNERI